MSLYFTQQHWNTSTHFEEKLNIDLTLSIIVATLKLAIGKKYFVKLANAQAHMCTFLLTILRR